MRLMHRDFNFAFEFEENARNILVIESPLVFRRLVKELYCNNEDSGFVLSENFTPLKLSDNINCIVDYFNFSLNERKILNKLQDYLKAEVSSSDLLLEQGTIFSLIEQYALNLQQISDWQLDFDYKPDFYTLFKFMNVRFKEEGSDLLERLVDYVTAANEFCAVKLFVLVDLFFYFTEDEIEKLYAHFNYKKLNLLLIESRAPTNIRSFANAVVIDRDCCEINLGML